MPGALWRTDETVVLVYFQSRKVGHEACRKLIQHKCGTQRDLSGVRGKLASIRNAFPELWDTNSQEWNLDVVDEWLLEQDPANFSYLTSFEPEDQQIVSAVSSRACDQTKSFKTD